MESLIEITGISERLEKHVAKIETYSYDEYIWRKRLRTIDKNSKLFKDIEAKVKLLSGYVVTGKHLLNSVLIKYGRVDKSDGFYTHDEISYNRIIKRMQSLSIRNYMDWRKELEK